jgi:hypothetical protein
MGRYSTGYFLFVAIYAGYFIAALLIYLGADMKATMIGKIQNAISALVTSRSVNVIGIYSVLRTWVIGLMLVSCTVYFLASSWKFITAIYGRGHDHLSMIYGLAVLGTLLIVAGITKSVTGRFIDVGRLRTSSVVLAGGFLLLLGKAIGLYAARIGPVEMETWSNITPVGFPNIVSWFLVMPAIFVALEMILRPDYTGRMRALESDLRNVGILMVSGVCAYAVVLIFAPGYIFSAYLARWAIFPSFLFILAFAIAAYVYFMVARSSISNLRNGNANVISSGRVLTSRNA